MKVEVMFCEVCKEQIYYSTNMEKWLHCEHYKQIDQWTTSVIFYDHEPELGKITTRIIEV